MERLLSLKGMGMRPRDFIGPPKPMAINTTCSMFLDQFPEGSPEREYHALLLSIIDKIDFEISEVFGFAFLRFLDLYDFRSSTLSTVVHPLGGSLYDNAKLVSYLFSQINPDPYWWVYRFQVMAASDFNVEAVEFWRNVFDASELVEELIGPAMPRKR